MLPARHRMSRRPDFDAAFAGRRAGTRTVLVALGRTRVAASTDQDPRADAPLVGLVVSRAVGGAVSRNQVKRRLRSAMRPLVPRLPPGARVVVRAQPAAADAPYAVLARDVERALTRAGAAHEAAR